jgi:aminopeptidase N
MSEQNQDGGGFITRRRVAIAVGGLIALPLVYALFAALVGDGGGGPDDLAGAVTATATATDPGASTGPTETANPSATPTGTPTAAATPAETPTPTHTPTPTQTAVPIPTLTLPDDVDAGDYERAFRAGQAPDPEVLAALPHYDIALHVSDDSRLIHGRQRLTYTNHEGQPLEEIVLRFYPNHPPITDEPPRDRMSVDDVTVNGEPAAPFFEADQTAMAVPLPQPLAPGEQVSLQMDFRIRLEAAGESAGVEPDTYYPILAVHDAQEGWSRELACGIDYVVSESATYVVSVTAPAGWEIAATGVELSTTVNEDGWRTRTYVAALVRNFSLSLSAGYQVASRDVDGVTVNVFHNPADEEAAAMIQGFATDALGVYDTAFGAYPYAELDIVVLPDGAGGLEFPTLVYVWYGSNPNDPFSEAATVHEVAHQWWYGVVGNDNQEEAWLDEGFASYSEHVYYERVRGADTANEILEAEEASYNRWAQDAGPEAQALGQHVCNLDDLRQFINVVYTRGALFLHTLRQTVGDDVFFSILRQYYAANAYETATTEAFQATAERVSGMDLASLFEEWVGP